MALTTIILLVLLHSNLFQDFSIQQLERRINRMQGEHSNEEKLALEARIKELTEHLEERQQAHTLLSAQLKRLQDDIRRAKRDLEKSSNEMSDLTVCKIHKSKDFIYLAFGLYTIEKLFVLVANICSTVAPTCMPNT